MSQKKQCVIVQNTQRDWVQGVWARGNAYLNQVSLSWVVRALASAFTVQAQASAAGAKLKKRLLRSGVALVGAGMLSGCELDLSGFAGSVGDASGQFACAVIKLIFECEL